MWIAIVAPTLQLVLTPRACDLTSWLFCILLCAHYPLGFCLTCRIGHGYILDYVVVRRCCATVGLCCRRSFPCSLWRSTTPPTCSLLGSGLTRCTNSMALPSTPSSLPSRYVCCPLTTLLIAITPSVQTAYLGGAAVLPASGIGNTILYCICMPESPDRGSGF